jgi:hypothetical protein
MGLKGVAVLNEQGWSGSVLREPALSIKIGAAVE